MMLRWLKNGSEAIFLGIILLLGAGYFSYLGILFPDRIETSRLVFAIWALSLVSGEVVLYGRLPVRDKWLFAGVMFLIGWGLLILTRLAPDLAIQQAIWLMIGLCVLLIIALSPLPLRWFIKYSWWIAGGAVLLLLITFIIGVHPSLPRGAPTLWLSLDRFFIQPSELLKLVLVGCFAVQIAHTNWRNIFFLWGVVIGLFIFQRDFGVAVLFVAVLFQLAYLAGTHWRILGVSVVLFGVVLLIGYFSLPIIRLRVMIWLNPWIDSTGDSYQLVQSLLAFADGGVFGRGFGQGNPDIIPLAYSDFIFSAIAEEWGLMGIIAVMTCVGLVIWRAMLIGNRHSDIAYRYFAWGIGLMLFTQNMMIMGGALRIFPLTGMPLTFVSYGGSSLVVSMMMIGVLLRLSIESESPKIPHTRINWQWRGILAIFGMIFCVAFYWAVLWDV
ncbi:MAG: FtsW/RodA/SpoVE family cell cycle protein [Phototrophicales bacterium]|nr:FtsW/RodA/SpoVE family cell cycle protein [Phototrophicales bacterium]